MIFIRLSVFALLACIGTFHPAYSQVATRLDSLRRALHEHSDSAKVDIGNRLTDEYLFRNNDSALHFAQEASALATVLQYKKGEIASANNLGIIYGMRGDYAHALRQFTRSLRLQEQLHDDQGLAGTLSNIAKLYTEQSNYTEALRCLNRARDIDAALNNRGNLADDYLNIGIVKKELADLTGALQDQKLALDINYALQDSFSIATGLVNVGEIYVLQEKYALARDSAQKAADWFKGLDNPYGSMHALHVLANAFQGLKRYDRAAGYSLQALSIARQQNSQEKELEIYHTLVEVSAQSGNYKNALAYQQRYQALHDTLFNAEKTKILNEIKEEYDTEKREQRIRFLEDEAGYQARLRGLYVLASGLVLCMLILVIRNMRRGSRVLQEEKKIAEQNLMLELEKAYIREERLGQERMRERLDKEAMRQEQEKILLEKQRMELALDENQRQLLTYTLQIQQNREMLTEFQDTISKLKKTKDPVELKKGMDQVIKSLQQQIDLGDDWEHIKLQFEKVHPSFFKDLKERFPSLTLTELKLCAYTKMNFNGKEMSRLLNINPSSIQVARYRLKKKMNLPEEVNFPQFITENF